MRLTLHDPDYVVVPQDQASFQALMSFLVPIPALRASLPPVLTWLPLTHCGGDNLPKADVHVEPGNVTLCGKRVFAHVLKDLKARPSWITQVGPKSKDKCPYKRGRRDTDSLMKARGGRDWSHAATNQEVPRPSKAGGDEEGILP